MSAVHSKISVRIRRFEVALDAAIESLGIDTILELAAEYEKIEPEFECLEILDDLHAVQNWHKLYKGGTANFQKKGRTLFFAHVPISTEFLESIMEIEELFTDATEEIGFYNVMMDLLEGPTPIAKRMQPVSFNDQLRFNNKKGRLVATQGEYELVTFNIPRCADRLKDILLHAYKQDVSKTHLRKYITHKFEEELGL